MQVSPRLIPEAHAVTYGPGHHFFGYYDKSPWDISGRWLLGMRTKFMDRPPTEADVLEIGVIDTQDCNQWAPLAFTRAWNWQQGCMLQWLGDGSRGEIIFNDKRNGRFISRILNIHSGEERLLERPIYAVNASGTMGASINFSRLHHQRPGYGYPGIPDLWEHVDRPEDDGIYSIDLDTGEHRLILSIAQAAEFRPKLAFAGRMHRFNHLQFSPRDDHFAVLHRYKTPREGVGLTRLLTMNLDGSDLRCLADYGMFSHYDWLDERSIVAWAEQEGLGQRYFLYREDTDLVEEIGAGLFSTDGHCSFSPDRRWMLTDTYPDAERMRTLMLYDWENHQRIDLGRFYSPDVHWEIRCDLHPRWSRDGRKICIDSVHEGTRQMYVLDISGIVG